MKTCIEHISHELAIARCCLQFALKRSNICHRHVAPVADLQDAPQLGDGWLQVESLKVAGLAAEAPKNFQLAALGWHEPGEGFQFPSVLIRINQDRGVISSISPCEGDGPGAKPGILTNFENKNAWRALK